MRYCVVMVCGNGTFTTQSQLLMTLSKQTPEKIVGKEYAGHQHFLLFPQCFLHSPRQISLTIHIYFVIWKCFQHGPV